MLTYRTGAAGTPSVAGSMATHLAVETDAPEIQANLAEYYGNAMKGEPGATAALARRDMHPEVADRLGIDLNRPLTLQEVTNLLTGLRADGEPIPGKAVHKITDDKTRIGYIDLCLSAPKSFSVALAFAPTEAERAILDRAHRDAVDATIKHVEEYIGLRRIGDGGKKGAEPGHIGWVQFDHYTARPTVKIPRIENGIHATELLTVKVAGDPQRHTHVIVPNLVVTDSGRIGGLYLQQIKDRIHEWGAIYQAYLATNLRRSGVNVELDSDETKSLSQRMARLQDVPRAVCDLFSKRSQDGEAAAKAYAAAQGTDWDKLSADDKAKLLKGGTKAARRSKELGRAAQTDDLADYSEWKKQAKDAGYRHRSVLRPGEKVKLASQHERLAKAYEASLPLLQSEIENRSVFEGSLARVCAAKGLIATGIQDPSEINAITKAYRTEGVKQNREFTSLRWGKVKDSKLAGFTTEKHIEQEIEAIALLSEASKDKSGALTPAQIEAAVQKVVAAKGYDFTSEHGQNQRAMIERLGTGGRVAVGIGVHGAGKTTLIEPLVEAWHAAGRRTIGVTLAWRQAKGLEEAGVGKRKRIKRVPAPSKLTAAGIEKSDTYALAAFLRGVQMGGITPDRNTVVVVDEIAQVGTKQVLELARFQKKFGFQIVAMGDDRQCQAIEAGHTIRLLQKALGEEQVPQLLTTIRQNADRDKETALLFRQGKADEALSRKEEDGQLHIVAGGYKQAIEAAVDLWQERMAAKPKSPRYTIAISAPTNQDVREIGAEIRKRRQAAGEVGKNRIVLKHVSDQVGDTYDLPLAVGDRLRLFRRVADENGAAFGFNGTIVEVRSIKPKEGMLLRNPSGREAFIKWDSFRPQMNGVPVGPIMLTYGDALTIDARQGDTVSEHITVMPAGSKAVNGFKAYTTESRHRVQSWIVTSQGEEMQEIVSRRPLGDPRNNTTNNNKIREAIIENMARNLSRHPEKVLATDFVEKASGVRVGSIQSMQAAWHRSEIRVEKPKPVKQHKAAKKSVEELNRVTKAVQDQLSAIDRVSDALRDVKTVPQPPKPVPQSPRKEQKGMSETEVLMEFKEACASLGLKIDGMPVMDGKRHYVPLLDGKASKKAGGYKAYLEGIRPAGTIANYKTGEVLHWKADTAMARMAPAELAKLRQESEAMRAKRAADQLAKELSVAEKADALWRGSKIATNHPYLKAKCISAYGLREGRAGQVAEMSTRSVSIEGKLLVPLRDVDGKIWNLQMIGRDSSKMFLPGRKRGLFATIGRFEDGKPAAVTEGFATGATIREATHLPTVVAFDSGNIKPVVEAILSKKPDQKFIYAADNDHHLPRRTPPLANVGIEKAKDAAALTGGPVIAPDFPPESKGSDWNDYTAKHGVAATRVSFSGKLSEYGMSLPERQAQQAQASGSAQITQEQRDAARASLKPRGRSHHDQRRQQQSSKSKSQQPQQGA